MACTLHHRGHGGHRDLVSDHTPDAVTQMRNIEIDQQPELVATEFQIGENLGEMQREQFLHCLQLQNHAIFDDEINPVGCVELNAVIDDGESHLMGEADAVSRELVAKAGAVSAFKTAGSQCCVHSESGAEDPFCDRSVKAQFFTSMSSASSVVESRVSQHHMQPPVL